MLPIDIMQKLKDIKVAFFDVDGTLSVPLYNVDGELKVGMSDETWIKFNIANSDSYKDCKPLNSIEFIAVLEYLKLKKVELYILTAESNSFAFYNKAKFVLEYYSEYFDREHIHFCSSSKDKVKIMTTFAKVRHLENSNILFVDDTFDLCIEASCAGIVAFHNSYFY